MGTGETGKEEGEGVRTASECVKRVEEILHPRLAILYGSYARGDFRFLEGEGIEPKAFTQKEFYKMLRDKNSLPSIALREGIVLLDKCFFKGKI